MIEAADKNLEGLPYHGRYNQLAFYAFTRETVHIKLGSLILFDVRIVRIDTKEINTIIHWESNDDFGSFILDDTCIRTFNMDSWERYVSTNEENEVKMTELVNKTRYTEEGR